MKLHLYHARIIEYIEEIGRIFNITVITSNSAMFWRCLHINERKHYFQDMENYSTIYKFRTNLFVKNDKMTLGWLSAIFIGLLWGSTWIIGIPLLKSMDPIVLVWLRYVMSVITLFILLKFSKEKNKWPNGLI